MFVPHLFLRGVYRPPSHRCRLRISARKVHNRIPVLPSMAAHEKAMPFAESPP